MTTEVSEQVKIALHHIERAQMEIELACQALSPIRGAVPIWTATCKIYEAVQALWYRLNKAETSKWNV